MFALAILAVAAAVVAWFWPEDLEIDPRLVARFAPAMASYGAEFPPAAGSSAYVVGRLIPIEREPLDEVEVPRGFDPEAVEGALPASRWRLDDLYNSLPPDLVASSPDEVGTLARVSCGLVEDGLYVVEGSDDVAPGTAYRWRCSIELIDLRAGHQIARQDFLGGPPVFSTLVRDDFSGAPGARVAGNAYGPHPRDEMVEFLSALPRR